MKRPIALAVLALLGGLAISGCSESSDPLGPRGATSAAEIQPDQVTSFSTDLQTIDAAIVMAPEATLGPVLRFSGQTDFADASFFDFTGEAYVFGYLYVFRDKSSSSQVAQLSYDITECTIDFFVCETIEAGFGSIPAGDVTFTTNSVRLGTNTGVDENPDFFRWLGDGGPIDVTWTSTPFFSTAMVLNERSQFGSIKVRRHEDSEYTSAMAEGSLFLEDLVAEGAFGSSRSSHIEISVGNVVAAASGSGHITSGGEQRTFSFHALQTSDGRVGGEWQRYNRARDGRAHGKVTCMTFVANTAWMGGFSTSSTTGTGTVRWRVFDGGQGGSQDAISLQDTFDPADTDGYCWGQPDYPELIPIESGNVSIRP